MSSSSLGGPSAHVGDFKESQKILSLSLGNRNNFGSPNLSKTGSDLI